MPRFYCNNEGCELNGEEIVEAKVKYSFSDEFNKLMPTPLLKCKKCGSILSEIRKEGMPQIGLFASMNEQQKKQVISNRAKTHFEKVGRHEKEFRKQQTIKKMLNG